MSYKFNDSFVDKIDEIQDIALQIYGKYDLEKSMLWMTEEFGEFFKAIRKNEPKDLVAGEMGDLLAWIICLGNILDIKISEAIKFNMNKEIGRQMRVYGKMKYSDNMKYISVGMDDDK